MANLSSTLKELRKERSRVANELSQFDRAIAALTKVVGRGSRGNLGSTGRTRRPLSAAARKRIAQAQKARWAEWKAKQRKKVA
jgi:hypothetical protein